MLLSLIRSIAYSVFVISLLDTILVSGMIASGAPVPSWSYFPPSFAGQILLSAAESWSHVAQQNNGLTMLSFFILLVIPRGLFFVVSNLVVGMAAGLPVMAARLLSAAGAPASVAMAVTIGATVIQMIAVVYFVDIIIAYIFGRTPILSMIFNE